MGEVHVARYILDQCGEMSTMKLQKLCYYAQAWSLVWDDEPLFDEEFEAWANGPVCRELYLQTKGQFTAVPDDEPGKPEVLTENQKDSIDRVIEFYGVRNAYWLSQLSHTEDPWNDARVGVPIGRGCNHIITKESMAIYYAGL